MLGQSLHFSRFLTNQPPLLGGFDTHPRWMPVTQSARSPRSYRKIGHCEQSYLWVEFLFVSGPLYLMLFFYVGSNAPAPQTLPSSELGCKTRFISLVLRFFHENHSE